MRQRRERERNTWIGIGALVTVSSHWKIILVVNAIIVHFRSLCTLTRNIGKE